MSEMGQVAGMYVSILFVIGGLAFAACRLGRIARTRQSTDNPLTHLTTFVLNPQCSVALVRTTHEELLLGLTAQHVTLLTKAALSPAVSRSEHRQSSVTHAHCRRQRRKVFNKTRRLSPHCQSFIVPKLPR